MLTDYIKETFEATSFVVLNFDNENKAILIELRQDIRSDTYDTAIISLNKVAVIDSVPTTKYNIAFLYEDGIFSVDYDQEEFDELEVRHEYVRGIRSETNVPDSYVIIPMTKLKKFE